jgi:hemerythrin-like metal-binding protein
MTSNEFSDTLEIGVPEIDAEHALQVQLIRGIKNALRTGDRISAIELMTQLDDFTNAHFIAEQLLMRLNAYPAYRAHEDAHDRLIDELRRLRHSIATSESDHSIATTSAIERWLIDHIQTADRALGTFLREKANSVIRPVTS